MSSTDYPHAAASAATPDGRYAPETPRRLNDGVLQSAEDAVLQDGLPETSPRTGEFSVGDGEAPDSAAARKQPLSASLDTMKAFVAQRPCTAALLAAGAGALTMMLLGKQVRRSRLALPWQGQRQRASH